MSYRSCSTYSTPVFNIFSLSDNVQNSNRKWKARWFVLSEDELSCQHKKNKSITINALPLHGASIICPCPHIFDYNTQVSVRVHMFFITILRYLSVSTHFLLQYSGINSQLMLVLFRYQQTAHASFSLSKLSLLINDWFNTNFMLVVLMVAIQMLCLWC